jgi:hypothetical protein
MNLSRILANPGVGNLLLVVAALIGVLGSYMLYSIRLDDRRKSARRAFKKEIGTASLLDTWIREADSEQDIPAQKIHPTTVYEQNVEDLGLLSDQEVDILVEFYSQLISVNDMLEYNRRLETEVAMKQGAVDRGKTHRKQAVIRNLNEAAILRWKAYQVLKKHLGEEYESPERMDIPEKAGETVSKDHPMVKKHTKKLLQRGYFEEVEEDETLLSLTEQGEEWIMDDSVFDETHDLDTELSLS